MGSSFECVRDSREFTLVKVYFFICLGNKAILLGRLYSGHIVHCFVQQRVVPSNLYIYIYIIIRQEEEIWM